MKTENFSLNYLSWIKIKNGFFSAKEVRGWL